MVFFPTTLAEHEDATDDGAITPKKVGKILAMRKIHSRDAALTSSEMCIALGSDVGDEVAVRKLERLAKGMLRAYCVEEERSFWWYYQPEG